MFAAGGLTVACGWVLPAEERQELFCGRQPGVGTSVGSEKDLWVRCGSTGRHRRWGGLCRGDIAGFGNPVQACFPPLPAGKK